MTSGGKVFWGLTEIITYSKGKASEGRPTTGQHELHCAIDDT